MDTAVVSEVLLFRLHIIYSLLLGSVLQPGDGATDPLQQLEAERKTRRKQKIIRLLFMRNLEQGSDTFSVKAVYPYGLVNEYTVW